MNAASLALPAWAALASLACPQPVLVTIPQARAHARTLEGVVVRIDGTVRRLEEPGALVLEDEGRDRIGITGRIVPLLPPLEGRRCRARGTLRHAPDRGLVLDGRGIEPIAPP